MAVKDAMMNGKAKTRASTVGSAGASGCRLRLSASPARVGHVVLTVLLVGVLGGLLGAAPASPQRPSPAAAGRAAVDEPIADRPLTDEEQRALLIETIRAENDLPPQADTGWANTEAWWMPQAASEQAAHVDFLFFFILWITVFFTALIIGLMVFFVIRYRRRSDDEDPAPAPTHSTTLEITWTVIPTCIVLVMFTLGFRGYMDQTISPPHAYTIDVTGRMWSWSFMYPNGGVTSDLHLPVDRPVRFVLMSEDVIHSLFIPAFRLKKDVVPGRFNSFWVTPNRPGIYEVYCAEYCGRDHSRMITKAFVYRQDDFEPMLRRVMDPYTDFATGEAVPLHQVGRTFWRTRGCMGCHSADGSIGQGPTWRNLWMAERRFTDGTTGIADEEYLRESIFQPGAKVVVGYGDTMPSYLGTLSERDVRAIIEFIKSLHEDYEIDPEGEVVPAATLRDPGDAGPAAGNAR